MSIEIDNSVEMPEWLRRHRWTVDQYCKMAEIGILALDERFELIDGRIMDMLPDQPLCAATIDHLNELMIRALDHRAWVRCRGPVRLSILSEPVPDFALVNRSYRRGDSHPSGADTLLVIEVSDGPLRYERELKIPLYARHGVPEVWLVDAESKQVHFYRSPHTDTYADVTSVTRPGVTVISALPDVTIDLSDLFLR
jgi:Uma2 family endonuclease